MTWGTAGVGAARWRRARPKVTQAEGSRYIPRMASSTRVEVTKVGVSFGSALAIAISWSTHHSILWACVHGILSWLYVIYYALTR